jgi:glycosyltransferase involved in cell wall biosynthesis
MNKDLHRTVLHVYSSNTAGGAEKTMLDLAFNLEKNGLRNLIAAPEGSYILEKARGMKLDARPLRINGSFDPLGIFGLLKIVRDGKVDIIHAHQGKVFWPCVFMKWFFKRTLKLVFHRHADLPHRFYSRGHYTAADAVIAISKAVAKNLIEKEGVPRGKVKVIYNGIDTDRFNKSVSGSAVRKEFGLEGHTVAGTVGAMNRPKGKGQAYLIEAAARMKSKNKNLKYLIVGDGEIRSELEALSNTLGVSDIVVFAGFRENVEEYIAAMDIFCLLSWDTEGFGQVMAEAQSMGKPVIGTNVGGVPETFIDGKTGRLIPPEDTDRLVDAIEFFSGDMGARIAYAHEAELFSRANFGIGAMTENVMKLYKELYAKK